MRMGGIALLALLAFAGGWWLGHRPDPRLAAQLAELTAQNAQLDSAVQRYRETIPAEAETITRFRETAAQHDTVTVRLLDSVLVILPDTLRPILVRVRAEHVATVADLTTALDTAIAGKARAEALLARSEQLRAANLALAAQAVHHIVPQWVTLSVGVGATYARGGIAVGPTVAVGVRVPL